MADKGRDPDIVAIETVYSALKDLEEPTRKRVLASVFALLGLSASESSNRVSNIQPPTPNLSVASASRPISLVELANDKKPGTTAQRIALFAYYREKSEALPRFSRGDLKPYFAKAKVSPPGNFDRDFVEAVKRGWIHEDGSESYLTTRGIEVVESGFQGEQTAGGRASAAKKKTAQRSAGSKRAKRRPHKS